MAADQISELSFLIMLLALYAAGITAAVYIIGGNISGKAWIVLVYFIGAFAEIILGILFPSLAEIHNPSSMFDQVLQLLIGLMTLVLAFFGFVAGIKLFNMLLERLLAGEKKPFVSYLGLVYVILCGGLKAVAYLAIINRPTVI
jgi:hypothetical protein